MDFLLQTKLAVPVIRERLMARARLFQRLDDGLLHEDAFQRRLTLVVAPAGYGKTTLVASWLHAANRPFAWLSLDEQDNDTARFLAYLLAAFGSYGIGDGARKALQSPQPPAAEAVLSILLNEIAACRGLLTLVLDDYHAIHTPGIHALVSFFLEHQPASVHLVIITREDPLLPVPRLRARGQALELRQEDLRFTPGETSQFLCEVMALNLAADDIAALEEHTEGWIAGLQLAALAMQGLSSRGELEVKDFIRAFAGSNRFILDYLMSEVFQQQDEDMQAFLRNTSILERLCAPLCLALTGREDSQALLEQLEKANLFLIPLDLAGQWFRYHHLFAEFLRHRLRLLPAAGLPELHRRASQWFEENGYPDEAIEHALSSGDWERASRLIDSIRDRMLRHGEIAGLLNHYSRLPAELVRSNPQLALGYAWPLLLSGQCDRAEALMLAVEMDVPAGSRVEGDLYAHRAYLARARGDHPGVIAASVKALSLFGPSDLAAWGPVAVNLGIAYWHTGRLDETEQMMARVQQVAAQTGNSYALLTASFFRARTLACRGALRQAEIQYRQLLQHSGQTPITALIDFDLAVLALEWNRLEEAEDLVSQAMEISAQTGNAEFLSSGHLLQAMILLARKNIAAALREAAQALELARAYPPVVQARSLSLQSYIHLTSGDLEEAERLAGQMQAGADYHPLYRFLDLTRPRLLLAQGRRQEARDLLLPACRQARQNGWGYGLAAALVLLSLAGQSPDESGVALGEALQLAEPEGFLRTFTSAGPGLAPLLKEAARRGIHPQYAGELLAEIGIAQAPQPVPGLAEPLSERELEVLRLVAAGLSNREIARQLIVTLGTAKTHVHNICGKLGVGNRTEAAVRAHELGLI